MKRFPLLVFLTLLLLLVPGGVVADPPHPLSISPSSISNTNTNPVKLIITGSGFDQRITAEIMPCYGTRQPVSVAWNSPSQITITYSFYGGREGGWHIYVKNPDGSGGVINFQISGPSSTGTTTTVTTTETTTATPTTQSTGKNSIFFETNPTGATIILDGTEVGTSAFKYYTDKDGTFNVVAKKLGYEDYEGKVTVVDGGPTAHFYALLTPLSSTSTATTTAVTGVTKTTGPAKTTTKIANATTTIKRSTLKIPTPLGTDPPLTAEESPVDPAIAFWAAGIAVMLVVIRRR